MSILPEARKPSCFEWRLGDHISPPLPNPNCLISHELLTSHAALGPLALRFSLRVTYSLQEHEVKTEYLYERVQGAILSSHYLKIASFCQKCTGLHPLSHPVSGIKQCVSPSPLARPRGRLRPRPLCMDSSFKRAFSRFAQCESAPLFLPLCPPLPPSLS